MSLKIVITSSEVQEKSGVAKGSGKPYHIREQTGWAHTYSRSGVLNPYPEQFLISLRDDEQPYPPGEYTLHPSAFWVGDFKKLEFTARLAPVKKSNTPQA